METEQAKHEMEESLMLAQFETSCNFSHKLQNGAQSSEEDSLQITEDTNWNTQSAHYKPSKGVSSVKRYRENCNVPASEQGLSKMNGDLTNGELNHALTEQSLLAHQPKKMKVDVESRDNVDTSYKFVNNFSESERGSQQTETNFDKRNCHGDIFRLQRNKQAPNGAVSSSSTIESTPGDLLEKTLSQYYPEQVSIAPQTSGSQLDTVNDSLTSQLSSEGAQPTALTSKFQTNSSHIPDLQQQHVETSADAEGGNNYNSVKYSVNGYSHNFDINHQQQQPPSYSGQELALGPLPDMVRSFRNAGSSQHPSREQCFPNDTNPQVKYTEAQKEFNPGSFVKLSDPLHTAETGGYGSFHNSGIQENKQKEKSAVGQILHHGTGRGQHYESQTLNFEENVEKQQRPDGFGHIGPGHQQPHHIRMENGMENTQRRADMSCSTPSQTAWIDGNTSQSQKQPTSGPSSQGQEQDMWRGIPGKPQPEQQQEDSQVCSRLLESNLVQHYRQTQTQGVFTDSNQRSSSSQQKQQDCLPSQRQCASTQHNTAPEWQQSNLKTPQMQQTLLKKMPEQRNVLQNQQAENCYQFQREPEHLCDDNDLQDILSAGFVTTHQQQQEQQLCLIQRPLSHPPQSEGQQLNSPNYRPHSQPPPGSQLQTEQPLRNGSAQACNQDVHRIDQPTFTYNNATETPQPHPQKQLFTNSNSKNLKQFQPQQSNNHCHETNQVDFPQNLTQSQPYLPQGVVNQQVTSQMYFKAEQQMKTSCTQFQMGPQLPLRPVGPHGDSQRHAALRMHLLQKQERHGSCHPLQGSNDPKQIHRGVKIENGTRFELPASRQQEQLMQMREVGMGGVHIKQESQQALCVQNKKQGSILSSMEQSLKNYQLSPVFEKKSIMVNSSNKVKVESSGPVTILSANTDINRIESSPGASSTLALKKNLDSTPKKEQLLKTFMDSPIKLLDTPIKNLLDTPMKTQYEIPSCHCVGESYIVSAEKGLVST